MKKALIILLILSIVGGIVYYFFFYKKKKDIENATAWPLKLGSTGEAVEILQEYLNERIENQTSNYYVPMDKLVVDGKFGQSTLDAVKAYMNGADSVTQSQFETIIL